MFIDRQKLEKEYLDELTKLGNLLDTIKVDYCVSGEYALLAHGIKTRQPSDCTVVCKSEQKSNLIEMLFKLNYTIVGLSNDAIKIKKNAGTGDIIINIVFGKEDNKNFAVALNGKQHIFSSKFFDQDRKEVWSYLAKKGGKGYFKVASLEDIYLTKINSNNESDLLDLEIIKGSGKLDIEKLIKLFEKNGFA